MLGLWTSANEGSKFWLQVLTEIRNRGVKDIFIACVDGLKGFPEAIEAVYRQTQVQLCIVHLVRHSLNYVSYKQRREAACDLRPIYTAATEEAAEIALDGFASKWDATHPTISQVWRRNWTCTSEDLGQFGPSQDGLHGSFQHPSSQGASLPHRSADRVFGCRYARPQCP